MIQANGYTLNNRYRIINMLMEKNFSSTYIGYDGHLNTNWAIKEIYLHSWPSQDRAKIAAAFMQAAQEASKNLDHPCILKSIDYFCQGSSVYIVRPFFQGADLYAHIRSGSMLSEFVIVNIGVQLCDVITYLQSRGHGRGLDQKIKPPSIILDNAGRICLLDADMISFYSSIRLPDESMMYMPPEGATGVSSTEEKRLVYMIGALLYHLLTGYNPQNVIALPRLSERRPDVCSATRNAIEKATKSNPRGRCGSVSELAVMLQKAAQTVARRDGVSEAAVYSSRSGSSGGGGLMWIMVLISLVLAGGAGAVLYKMFLS